MGERETNVSETQPEIHKNMAKKLAIQRKKGASSVENTMGDFPTEINSLAIKIEKMERTPLVRPIKVTKSRCKFHNTVWLDHILR